MTKFLTVFAALLMLYRAGIAFGGIVQDAQGHDYAAVSWCTMHLNADHTEVTGKEGTVGGRCYIPVDGGTADDYQIWQHGEALNDDTSRED